MSKPSRTEPIVIILPFELEEAMTRFIEEGRFNSHLEFVIEAVQAWIDVEDDEDFWVVCQKHDENPAEFGCLDDEDAVDQIERYRDGDGKHNWFRIKRKTSSDN